jgi:hypothetical protein
MKRHLVSPACNQLAGFARSRTQLCFRYSVPVKGETQSRWNQTNCLRLTKKSPESRNATSCRRRAAHTGLSEVRGFAGQVPADQNRLGHVQVVSA